MRINYFSTLLKRGRIFKWYHYIIPLILPLVTVFISCDQQTSEKQFPIAKNGVLDLAHWDFQKDGPVNLNGEWKFKWMESEAGFISPDYDDSGWDTFDVPGFWNHKTKKSSGHCWLRLKIVNINAQNPELFIEGAVYSAYNFYVNGQKVVTVGKTGYTRKTFEPKFINQYAVLPDDDTLLLAWEIVNYHTYQGGLEPKMEIAIGNQMDIVSSRRTALIKSYIIKYMTLGIMFMMFLYHILLWVVMREDKVSLYFGLLCLSLSIRFFTANAIEIQEVFHTIDLYKFLEKVVRLPVLMFTYFYIAYLQELYKKECNHTIYKILKIILIIYFFFFLFTPNRIINRLNFILSSIIVIVIIISAFSIYKAVRNRRKYSLILMIGLGFLFIGALNDSIAVLLMDYNVYIAYYVFVVFIFSQSTVLSLRFAQAYRTARHLSINLRQEVDIKTAELQKSNQEKTNFFINLAHETKTPLTLIGNYLDQYINKTGITEELIIVKQNIEKLTNDMVNFLDAEKLARSQLFFNHELVSNLSVILEHKLALFNKTAIKKRISLISTIHEQLYTKADPTALDRIINNLLDNAVKYTEEEGKIMVGLERVDNHIKLTVSDSGIGISQEQIDLIFSPYHQLSHEKRNIQGIGMGLHITNKLIESLNGSINVESEVGKGTVFTVLLNYYEVESGEIITTNVELSRPVTIIADNKKLVENDYDCALDTIFLVEDNVQMLIYLKSILEGDYNIYFALNGREALDKLESVPKPDLIISDVMMDVMDGYQFFEHLSKMSTFSDVPVIFLTAKSTLNNKISAISKGAIDYLYKPFSREELQAKINSLIRNQKIKQAMYERDKFATLGMLTGGICHEIANPLNLIYGPIDLLEMELKKLGVGDNENVILYLERIMDNVRRIEKIINGMKHFNFHSELKKEPIDIKTAVESLREIFYNKTKDRISLNLVVENDVTLIGDSDALGHILINLVSNAIDAIDDKGIVDIIVTRKDGRSIIKVTDNGSGIDNDKLPYIFNAFYSGKSVGRGTGLGLYIVKDLVIKSGWKIDVESVPGMGTTFIITT